MLEARPYPAHLIETWVVGSDAGVFIRPALREDHGLVVRFLSSLGPERRGGVRPCTDLSGKGQAVTRCYKSDRR